MSMLDNFPCRCGQCSECRASHTRYVNEQAAKFKELCAVFTEESAIAMVREVHQKKREAERIATERQNRKALNDAELEMRAATYRFESLKRRMQEVPPSGLERDWFDINDR